MVFLMCYVLWTQWNREQSLSHLVISYGHSQPLTSQCCCSSELQGVTPFSHTWLLPRIYYYSNASKMGQRMLLQIHLPFLWKCNHILHSSPYNLPHESASLVRSFDIFSLYNCFYKILYQYHWAPSLRIVYNILGFNVPSVSIAELLTGTFMFVMVNKYSSAS